MNRRQMWVQAIVAGVFALYAYWIGIRVGVNIIAPATVHADVRVGVPNFGEVRMPDPWGQVGQDVSIRAVDIGGLECAVLVQREGSERRTQLWCRAR